MKAYIDDIIAETRALIRIDSTKAPPEPGCPFGRGSAECLNYFLDLASSLGFETYNYDNYIGEVVFGEGEDFAILAHLDVVPAGEGWDYPPFGAVMNDDISRGGTPGMKIWGRGAIDDKAPAVAALYALYALKDKGIVPKRRFKLIVGCDEESGWGCIEHYNKVSRLPREGFTPDADFPVIYAEFGILHVRLRFSVTDIPLVSLSAGTAINMVPATAAATLKEPLSVSEVDGVQSNGTRLSAVGVSAHASRPERGVNALGLVLKSLSSVSKNILGIYELLFLDKLSLTEIEDETGRLTISPDIAEYSDGTLSLSVDIRYPATHTADEITDKFNTYGINYEILEHKAPLYNDPDGALISTLKGVYDRYTGKESMPVSIGGGTYARALECGCGFGPDTGDMEYPAHAANEFVTVEHIELMSQVYYEALVELGK